MLSSIQKPINRLKRLPLHLTFFNSERLVKRLTNYRPFLPAVAAFCVLALSGCEIKITNEPKVKSVVQGSSSNPATGMKTTYRNIEAGSVKMIMNEEVLGHADIPLGEKFYVVNTDVKGLQVKNDKVSVGCALQITDETGKMIMNETDLFSGNDLFNKDEATYLRCAVSTGLPMEAENYYTVKVKFWDKFGDGFIENMVKIRVIDMP
jgi:hypothetical protein